MQNSNRHYHQPLDCVPWLPNHYILGISHNGGKKYTVSVRPIEESESLDQYTTIKIVDKLINKLIKDSKS